MSDTNAGTSSMPIWKILLAGLMSIWIIDSFGALPSSPLAAYAEEEEEEEEEEEFEEEIRGSAAQPDCIYAPHLKKCSGIDGEVASSGDDGAGQSDGGSYTEEEESHSEAQ